MHYCGMSEDYVLHELPFVRGLQYIHSALLSQGAHCVKPEESKHEFDCMIAKHSAIVQSYQQKTDDGD